MIENSAEIGNDIESAMADGSIILPREKKIFWPFGFDDNHSYLGLSTDNTSTFDVGESNSRPLRYEPRLIVEFLHQNPAFGNQWMESGAGSGVAVGQLSDLGMIVDTISLTALAPHVRPHRNLAEDLEDWVRIPQQKKTNDEIREILLGRFSRVATPYLRQQYLGRFPLDMTLPQREYSVFNESCGAVHYSKDADLQHLAIQNAMDAVREDGAIILRPLIADARKKVRSAIESGRGHCRVFLEESKLRTGDYAVALIAKPDHPLARERRNGSLVTPVSSITEFLSSFVGRSVESLLDEDAKDKTFGRLCVTDYTKEGYRVRPWSL